MKFAAQVSYHGGLFNGWQMQLGLPTVQGEIEKVLSLINNGQVKVTGSGRTDAGVHAWGQVCSFEMSGSWRADKLMLAVNANLPTGIQFMRVAQTEGDFNARFDAKSREYVYFIWNGRAIYPHIEPFVCHLKARNYDWQLAADACGLLEGSHDFRAFCKKNELPENSVRTLYRVCLHKRGKLLWLHVKGDAFLMNMMRIMVGNLELIAAKKKKADWLSELLKTGQREDSGRTFPASGLFFWKANYERKIF